jgi:signal transduction histidine kinase
VTGRPPDEQLALDETTLRRLLEAGRSLVKLLDLERILDNLLGVATELTRARYAAIGVLNEERSGLERFVTHGFDADTHRAIGDLPRGRGVLGVLITDPRPLRLPHVGDHPRSYGFPVSHPPMSSFLGVPITIRGEAWGNLYLTEKQDDDEFTAADEQTVMVLAEWAGIAIDNARLFKGVQARKDQLERAVQGLEATTTIARAIGTETDVDRVLELIVKRGRDLVEARSLVLLLAEGDELTVAASAGQVQSRAVGSRIPIRATTAGDVLSSAHPRRMTDAQTMLTLEDAGLGVVGAETGMLVPLVYRGTPLGVLAAFDSMAGDAEFDSDQESLLVTFAASAATAVATAKTVERERLRDSLKAAESERRRWARELHDETLQGLGGLQVLLSAAGPAADRSSVDEAVGLAVAQIQEQIDGLRMLITELRPAALDHLGLKPALESLLARLGTVEGLDVTGELDLGPQRLDPEIETTIYRFVQEALTNTAKHARAEHVRVRLIPGPDAVEVEIADDGDGFDPAQRVEGFGLIGMHERAGLVGGEMRVESSEAGTTVRGWFPRETTETDAAIRSRSA